MTTQAYFEDIEKHILTELDKAEQSISVAVAWFTNANLYNKLCEKRGRGLTIELMLLDDDINRSSSIDLSRLETIGGLVYRVGNNEDGTLMHNKFCIIDLGTVINGSYNWSYKARHNHENITISYQAESLALQFVNEFQRLKLRYFPTDVGTGTPKELDAAQVIRRLTLIQNLIQLGDFEDVPLQLAKLRSFARVADLGGIVAALQTKHYGDALPSIEQFIQKHRQLATYQDPGIIGLRLEAKALEIQLTALTDEHTDLERTVHQFQVHHARELGTVIIELLRLRRERARTPDEKAEAEADHAAYEKDHDALKNQVLHVLTSEEQVDLHRLYRQATKLCHPDAVPPEHQKEAAAWFISLREAYEQNDTARVCEILDKLEYGIAFGSRAESLSELDRLRTWVKDLRSKVEALLQEILAIKNSDAYRTIATIADWDTYFRTQKERLSDELTRMKDERPVL